MADAPQGRVQIVNRALVQHLGMPASYTLDGEIETNGIVDLVWPGVAARAIATYDWSDCRKTFTPTPHATTPTTGWAYGFTLPAERIGEPLAILDQVAPREHNLRDFMLEAGSVYTNVTPVWVRCRVLLDPEYWDQGFAAAFVMALGSGLAVPMKQDGVLAAELDEQAYGSPREQGGGGLFGKLIALNRAAQPQGRRFMDDDPLTNARRM